MNERSVELKKRGIWVLSETGNGPCGRANKLDSVVERLSLRMKVPDTTQADVLDKGFSGPFRT